MHRQRSGYLTATTEWYVMGLTLELDGSMSPHAWIGLAHSAGQLETVRLDLEGPYLPFGGPERLVVAVGQSILGHVRLCT